ncbi:MAG: adenosylcobinamide-GDP ribazoletransferase [Verrucomicrobiota bacterium]|nr:adenosylcobinamide-GDP ribazoletransferase [Verrucomicrobiota bacterium]
MLRGLITAFRTLSILPVPGKDAERLAASLPWFPLVGLALGAAVFGVARLFTRDPRYFWSEAAAVVLLAVSALLTRGLHLDGLADWADGFWGARDPEQVLRIMKDPHKGSFGVIALVCILLAKWVCLARIVSAGWEAWIVTAWVTSRAMQAVLASTLPYARAGQGTAAPFVRGARPTHGLLALLLGMALLFGWHWLWPRESMSWLWLPAVAVGWLVTRAFGLWCRHRIGGITGDLIGACSELVETAVLAVGAFVARP